MDHTTCSTMSLDTLLNRRAFLGYGLGGSAVLLSERVLTQDIKKAPHFTEVPVTARQRDTFEKMHKMYAQFAKLDGKQKAQATPAFRKAFAAYWTSTLTKETTMLYDIATNPDANIAAWYAWQDPAQRPTLQKLIQNGTPVGIAMAEKDMTRGLGEHKFALLYNGVPGKAAKQTALVLDDAIFALETADEAWSILDYAHIFAHEAEHGIRPAGKVAKYGVSELWLLFGNREYVHEAGAYAAQLTNIFNGTRTVSGAFKESVQKQYLSRYRVCHHTKNIMNSSIEIAKKINSVAHIPAYEELRDFADARIAELNARMAAVGYRHQEAQYPKPWTLEAVPKQKTGKK